MGAILRVALRVATGLGLAIGWGRARDEANIRRLARREGCSLEDARRLYALARRDGYGAAHLAVFGPGAVARRPRPAPPDAAPQPAGAHARDTAEAATDVALVDSASS